MLTLRHNPHCSTSVPALEALDAAGHEVEVRKYLLAAERLDAGRVALAGAAAAGGRPARQRAEAWAEAGDVA